MKGLIIALRLKELQKKKLMKTIFWLLQKAGENWHQFVLYCISKIMADWKTFR